MTIEKKPHRCLCRRPMYFQVPIGVTFRQLHLQRTMLFAFRRVKLAAMKKEMKLLQNSHEEERVELEGMEARFTELEARFIQLRAERMHALTQFCLDYVEALLVAEDIADQLRDPLSGH
ncbi:hypothetical protein SLEP1_g52718 [Rubroshorea leprosula]|uniref:Uncharacterized protein n=1 Tax=Rubroshorea leprosula TaxID=152421 RepID=A0AAV5M8W9_9ROSI|nr:hypothetical protein SLEP1_g52718 [Rubroshorea leprosula]